MNSCVLCLGKKVYWGEVPNLGLGPSQIFVSYKCQECHSISFDHDSITDVAQFYPKIYFNNLAGLRKRWAISRQKNRLRLVKKHINMASDSVLDFGAGAGLFAQAVKQKGINVLLVENSEFALAMLRGLNIGFCYQSLDEFEELNVAKPKVITLWHVLEHMNEPFDVLDSLRTNLKNGGVIVFEVPNAQSLTFKVFGKHWVHLDPARHTHIPTVRGIERLAERLGMVCELSENLDRLRWFSFCFTSKLFPHSTSKVARIIIVILTVLISPLGFLEPKRLATTLTFTLRERKI